MVQPIAWSQTLAPLPSSLLSGCDDVEGPNYLKRLRCPVSRCLSQTVPGIRHQRWEHLRLSPGQTSPSLLRLIRSGMLNLPWIFVWTGFRRLQANYVMAHKLHEAEGQAMRRTARIWPIAITRGLRCVSLRLSL